MKKSFNKTEKDLFSMNFAAADNNYGLFTNLNSFKNCADDSTECVVKKANNTRGQVGTPFVIDVEYDDDMEIPIAIIDAKSDFGMIDNGIADNTDKLNEALLAASQQGGGMVYLPSGNYLINGTVTIPQGVTLRGEWVSPNKCAAASCGTVIIAGAKRSCDNDAPLFIAESSTALRNLTIIYSEQDPLNPTACGPAVSTVIGTNFNFVNVTIIGAWDGIMCGDNHNELYYLHNVYMYCYNVSFYNDNNSDIGRLENVQCDPAFFAENGLVKFSDKQKSAIYAYAHKKSTGFVMARNDWGYQYDILVRGYHYGFCFIHSNSNPGNHMAMNGQCVNVILENCDVGIYIEQTKICGIAFTNLSIECDIPCRAGIETASPYHGVCQFLNAEINGDFEYPVLSGGSSEKNMPGSLKFVNLEVGGYNSKVSYAITVLSGSVTVQNGIFSEPAHHMIAKQKTYSVSLLGCKFKTDADFVIDALAKERIQLDDKHVPCASYDSKMHCYKNFIPKPYSTAIFNVCDYGASPDNKDNTDAFNKALQAASSTGGTVYVPSGKFKFCGRICVPEGVELRGCWNCQYITECNGTMLLSYYGKNDENAEPFITLAKNSGIRGLTIFYPEQCLEGIVQYPWSVRAEGQGAWIEWVSLGNSYLGADFATFDCDRHFISWLVGSPLRKGLSVGNSETNGWIENVHFNPNYGRCSLCGVGSTYIRFQLENCEAITVGDCANEHILNSFVYGSRYGLGFVSQGNGGANAFVVGHATDGSESGIAVFEAKVVEIFNTQTTTMASNRKKRNIMTGNNFNGTLALFNCVGYGPVETMEQISVENGNVIAILYGFISGHGTYYVVMNGGKLYLNSATFDRTKGFAKIMDKKCEAEFIGNYCRPYEVTMKIDEIADGATAIIKDSWFA